VFLDDEEVFNSSLGALFYDLGAVSSIFFNISHARFDGGSIALIVHENASGVVTDSVFAGGDNVAIDVVSSTVGRSASLNMDRRTMSNYYTGIHAGDGAGQSTVRVAYSIITNNSTGINEGGNGHVLGRTDGAGNPTNTVEDNTILNLIPGTYAAK
jgi:hypothetical protein